MRFVLPLLSSVLLFLSASFAQPNAATLNGQLWVVNKLGDDVSVIDIQSRTVIATLPTGKGPHELAIDTNLRWAVVTDYVGGNSLSVFNIAERKLERTISLADYPRPHGVLFMPDQKHVAVSSEGSDNAVIVNVESGVITQVIATEAGGSHMVALPASGKVIYTPNMTADNVSVLSVEQGKLLRHIDMPETPEAITVKADNSTLWVGSNKDGWLSVFDTKRDTLKARWKDYTWPYRILYSPDEKTVLVPDLRQNTLDFYNAGTLTRTRRVQLPEDVTPKGLTFHPAGEVLFLSLYNVDQVAVIDVSSGEELFRLPTGDGPDGIGYVPAN
ncbi:YncE family protein [Aestuariibacter salexigens]|uniref:YncE family protein n=1 Tax=Aestuariibacter salexigens TaxID=226010 RepID=UPI0004087F3A|nr:YncE family protein [Aestuariibacter salexigens]